MLLTIFCLISIIISETLPFSSVEAHTFTITAYCTETEPRLIPRPFFGETSELLTTCLGRNELVIKGEKQIIPYEITDLEIKKMQHERIICTYTLENKTTVVPATIKTKMGEIVCDHYSEFQIKITAYCDANLSSMLEMPKPINAKANGIYSVCLDNKGKFGHKIRVNEVMGEKREYLKYICTYTFERDPFKVFTKNEEGACVNYSEIDEEKKKLSEQNAKVGGTSRKEMKKKGKA